MTLEEAIKENTKMMGAQQGKGLSKRIDALKLGNEAMKREQYHRSRYPNQSPNLLPGETKN